MADPFDDFQIFRGKFRRCSPPHPFARARTPWSTTSLITRMSFMRGWSAQRDSHPTEHSFSLGLENGPIPVGTARYPFEHVFRSEGPPQRQDRPARHAGPAAPLLRPAALRRGRLGLGDRPKPSTPGTALPPGGELPGPVPGAHGNEL